MPKVVSIGIAVLDVLARPLPNTPSKGDSTRVETIKMMPGGGALNVAVALSTMGVSAGLVTKTGADLNGATAGVPDAKELTYMRPFYVQHL